MSPTPSYRSPSWHGSAKRSRGKRRRCDAGLLILVLGAAAGIPAAARADGGIPGSLAILLPADQPRTLGLATTFGLILSDDGGATWSWTCEQPATTSMANAYAVGPPATASGGVGDRFYALSPVDGLALSDDQSCTWTSARGLAPGGSLSDFFVDPSAPAHVLAVVSVPADGGAATAAVFASTDGGATFGSAPLYTAPGGATIAGVEIARTDPKVIYVAYYSTGSSGWNPGLARSTDGGAHWTATDLSAPLGASIVRILAVDPQDSALVYLRVIAAAQDAVAVTRDGGGSLAVPIAFPGGQVSAFARLQSGTVLVGALVATASGGTQGTAVRSTDAAASFQPWTTLPEPTHLVGLAERVENGRPRLYLSAKNYSDGWALAVSDDEGATLTKLMTYDQVKGMKACVQQICLDSCKFVNSQGVWDLSVCSGASGGGDAAGGGVTGGGGATGGGSSGCGCGLDPTRPGGTLAGVLLCAAAAVWRRRRRPKL